MTPLELTEQQAPSGRGLQGAASCNGTFSALVPLYNINTS